MSFSSRRRNYLLTPHRRDGLIESMKSMLMHSFVLDALETTGADTFSHFEQLIDEHRQMTNELVTELNPNSAPGVATVASANLVVPSRLKQLIPGVGTFYTRLPLRKAFEAYNAKYGVTKRKYICISFNEIRQILNLAQVIAMIHPYSEGAPSDEDRSPLTAGSNVAQSVADSRALQAWASETPREDGDGEGSHKRKGSEGSLISNGSNSSPRPHVTERRERSESCAIEEGLSLLEGGFKGPKLLCFDGDQTLYSDGANFEQSPKLAKYLYLLLKHGATIAVVTAAGYEYQSAKYELRLSGLLAYFKERGLGEEQCSRFYIFGGECNYLLRLGADFKLNAVREDGPGGWMVTTKYISDSPGNWREGEVKSVLDKAERCFNACMKDQNMRARIIRKRRSVGMIPRVDEKLTREALDEAVLRIQTELENSKINLPFCAFNGGRDAWVDVGNKRVGVQVLQSYLGIPPEETLHIGDQFLNTGNDFAARTVCPCVWITSPEETTYILKTILRFAGIPLTALAPMSDGGNTESKTSRVDFDEAGRRTTIMDVYTGEIIKRPSLGS
mmetsp:Transcript_29048/g.69202  ORF Transcript_29048/g.69202 Transcript_29048/m.69202 type:complete len:560 (-) Transcript_29048:100-1779(-)